MADAITDEGVEQLRRRIGVAHPHTQPPCYFLPNEDAFRHVAEAYGDDNPLWCSPAYGEKTRWGGPIASPHLVGGDTLIGEDEVVTLSESDRALLRGDPLRGVHAFYSGSFREWWHPLRPNTRVARRNALVGVRGQSGRVRRPGRARMVGRGVRRRRRTGAVRSVPVDDPHRARKGDATEEERPDRGAALHRRGDRRHRRHLRRRARPTAGVPNPAGGRTSGRATRSAHWSRARCE